MSNLYKNPKDIPIELIKSRLNELAHCVADGKLSEFTMRIPAECDRDADIVLSEAANRIETMQAKLDAQAAELAALRGFAESVRIKDSESNWPLSDLFPNHLLKHFGLIDTDGNPTPLLTGVKIK
jgi:hypothetical protein